MSHLFVEHSRPLNQVYTLEGGSNQREKNPGRKVPLLSGNLWAIRKFFVSYDRKIVISLCTMKNCQTHAWKFLAGRKFLCHLITKMISFLFKIKKKIRNFFPGLSSLMGPQITWSDPGLSVVTPPSFPRFLHF